MTGLVAARSRYPLVPYQYYARTGSGHTPSRSVEEYWEDCDIPWVTTADVKHLRDGSRQVLEDTEFHVSELGLANSAARVHEPGTVVLSRTASVGFSAIMGRPMATSQDFVTWTPGAELDPRYLLWVLRSMKGSGDFDRLMYGSTHKTIYVPDLQQLRGPLPPLAVQRRIAGYLDAETARLDAILSRNRRLKDLLRERWHSLVTEAADAPGSQRASLRYVVRGIHSGADFPASELSTEPGRGLLRYVRTTDIIDTDRLTDSGVYVEQRLLAPTEVARDGDLLLTRAGSVGTAYRHQGEDVGFAGYLVKVIPGRCGSDFLRYWVESRQFADQVSVGAVRSTIDNFSASKYAAMQVPVLTEPQQERISRWLSAALEQRRKAENLLATQSRLLRERRQRLTAAAVTGELEV